MNSSYINAIGTAIPDHQIAQTDIARFMADALQLQGDKRQRLTALYRASGIDHRYSVLADYAQERGDFSFFPNTPNLEPFPSIQARMQLYRQEALPLSVSAVANCLQQLPEIQRGDITHLIYVSCTGMYAPGVDIALVHALALNTHVQRTAINFMGCYAAFNGLKVADSIVRANPEAKVLIVCTELCSIHFQKGEDEDNLLANALFADGSAAVLVSGENMPGQLQLSMEQFYCDLIPEGRDDMAWQIGTTGFEMRLSAYVPTLIHREVKQLTQRLLSTLVYDAPPEELAAVVDYYAIHPGGKRILQLVEEALGLKKQANQYAYQVLRNYGNMSSPTILFVLAALWQTLTPQDDNKQILGMAFGPGLTVESTLLRVAVL